MPNTLKHKFNLDIESADKTYSIANNVGQALVKKKMLMLGSKKNLIQLTTQVSVILIRIFA